MKGQTVYLSAKSVPRSGLSLVALARRMWRQVKRWQQLADQRRQLATLDDAALKDMGLSRGDVYVESRRPFWSDPMVKAPNNHKLEC